MGQSIPEPDTTPAERQEDATINTPLAEPDLVDQARRFLATDEVKNGSREKKVAFLHSKGLSKESIDKLLEEKEEQTQKSHEKLPAAPRISGTPSSSSPSVTGQSSAFPTQLQASMPPIVTYPEFLITAGKPPSMMTVPRLLNTLYAAGAAGIGLYGTSKFIVNPMVQTLTAAREELASSIDAKLDELVEKLEGVVSVIPPPRPFSGSLGSNKLHAKKKSLGSEEDDDSSDSDGQSDSDTSSSEPTEAFHRSIGTQTSASMRSSPGSSDRSSSSGNLAKGEQKNSSSLEAQSNRLSELTGSLRSLSHGFDAQRDGSQQISSLVDLLRADLDKISYPVSNNFSSVNIYGYASLGTGASSNGGSDGQHDKDEIKKVRDEIRRMKGVMLSTRSFPTTTVAAAAATSTSR